MGEAPERPLERLVGPILDLTAGICSVTDDDTASLEDPDEQAILIAVQLVHESLHAQTAQHTAQMARLQAFFEASPDAVILIDGQNRVLRWNSAATRLLAWQKQDVLGARIESLLPMLRPHLANNESGRGVPITREGATTTVDVSLARWREGAEWYRAITLRDQTARIAREQRHRQDQKLQQIGQLSAGIAHEISTPMQAVSDNLHFLTMVFDNLVGVVEAASQEPAPTSRLQQALARLKLDLVGEIPEAMTQSREALDHIARIVKAMKGFSHRGRGEPEAVDVASTIRTAVQLARPEWRNVAEVQPEIADDLPPVTGWADELKQVVLNLVVNAAHAIEAGPRNPGTIWIRAHGEPHRVVIEVHDNGCGMSESVRARVFDPFFTTKEEGKGSGQGLSITKGIVERHGGEIRVWSEVGLGTRFTVWLPLRDVRAGTGD